MDKKNNAFKRDSLHYIKSTMISVLIGEVATIISILIFAMSICFVDMPTVMYDIFVTLSAIIGGIVSGYFNGRIIKKKGYIVGGACGIVISTVLIILKTTFFITISFYGMIVKIILVILFSILGGILGVNRKTKRIKY